MSALGHLDKHILRDDDNIQQGFVLADHGKARADGSGWHCGVMSKAA